MSANLVRTSGGAAGEVSNVLTPHPNQPNYQWYETTYSTSGAQEWIFTPDMEEVFVTLTPSASTAQIEGTNSPPSVVLTGSPNVVAWSAGAVTVATNAKLEGFTAFRVNITVGTSAKISARA